MRNSTPVNLTSTKPFIFFLLTLPKGITGGFASILFPFILTQHGVSVATAASVTAIAASADIWRFLCAPVVDLTLNLHKWYLIAVGFCAAILLLFCFIPVSSSVNSFLYIIIFISQIAAVFVLSPVSGFMAKTVSEKKQGRACGWYQVGHMGGHGIGGGAGIWLAVHYSFQAAIVFLSVVMLACTIGLLFVPKVSIEKDRTLKQKFRMIGLDLRSMVRSSLILFTMFIVVCPMGTGAAASIWSSVAPDWHVSADKVALVSGILNGLLIAVGAIAGGWVADKFGRWWAYLGSATSMAFVTLLMTFFNPEPAVFITGVLCYAFTAGMGYAAFSAMIFYAIGKDLAPTKYAIISSLGNIPVAYMIAVDGWLHDKYNVNAMLLGETALGIGFVLISVFALSKMKFQKPVLVAKV